MVSNGGMKARETFLDFKKRYMYIVRNTSESKHNSVHVRNSQCAANTTTILKKDVSRFGAMHIFLCVARYLRLHNTSFPGSVNP